MYIVPLFFTTTRFLADRAPTPRKYDWGAMYLLWGKTFSGRQGSQTEEQGGVGYLFLAKNRLKRYRDAAEVYELLL